jgi:polysaccharide pyruvyl transferase WcaK-like protein
MTDLLLEAWVSGLIELNKLQWMLGAGRPWQPGEKLKLLFAGYNGTRNTGSDLRVEEMLRQVRRILGEQNIELGVMTQNFDYTRGYFGDARQVHLPDVYPPFLHREIRKYHGVVACEGSMFKSKFANALATMMIGSLGIAAAQNKLSVAFGAEAGAMDPLLQKMVRRYCGESLVITRNEESRNTLSELAVASELGTDTAWTFEPHAPEYGHKALHDAGWDGRTPVLLLCPINPFWWPVRASVFKAAARALTGAYKRSHYRTIYFHRSGKDVDAAYKKYLAAFGGAVERFRRTRKVFPVIVGMELLDRDACARLAEHIGGAPIFSSEHYDMHQLVSILRAGHLMASSRYHAIVASMPVGIPSAGITMDERIHNLMHERGHAHLLLRVDEPDLETKLFEVLQTLDKEAESIRESAGRTVAKNLRVMARMGMYLEQNVARRYPEFPARTGSLSWEDYLPPLGPGLHRLLDVYDAAPSRMAVGRA